jgi:hypothetical protein
MIERDHGSGMLVAGGQTFEFGWGTGQEAGEILVNMIPYYYFNWFSSADVPWMSTDPVSGTVPADSTIDVTTYFSATADAGILQPGDYAATLKVDGETGQPDVNVPVTMTVIAPPTWGKLDGTVTGLGACDVNPAPLDGAEVLITSDSGVTNTVTTNADGYYSYWLDEADSPYSAQVTYPEHETGSETGITITGQQTTTVDFDLRWLVPCMSVDPSSLAVTLDMGSSTSLPITLTNDGAGDAPFELTESDGGFVPAFQSAADRPAPAAAGPAVNLKGTSTAGNQVQPMASVLGQGSILHLYTADTTESIQRALNELGYAYDSMFAEDWTGIDFSPYDVVIIGMDGGFVTGPSLQKVRTDVIDQGKRLILMGGTCVQEFATGVNTYLVLNDTNNFCWSISNTPHWTLVDSGHPLAEDLPDSYNFIEIAAAFYQIRVNDPDIEPVAVNGDGFYNFFLKNSDFPSFAGKAAATGDFIWFTNSPFSSYWLNQADFDLFKQALANSVTLSGGDVPWLTEEPITGTVPADSSFGVTVTFDASLVGQPGDYSAAINVNTDDPVNDSIAVPVTMTVNVPPTFGKLEGTVTGLGSCDVNPAPLEEAVVVIEGASDTFTVTTDAAGYYSWWLDEAQSPLTVTVTYPDHETGQESGVIILAQQTTVLDFDLRWLVGCLSYSPAEIEETMEIGDIVSNTVTITNSGAGVMNWEANIGGYDGPLLGEAKISIPASDGSFPRGAAATSYGAAPIAPTVGSVPASTVQIPLGSIAYSIEAANAYFTAFDLDIPQELPNLASFTTPGFPGAGEYVEGFVYITDGGSLYQVDPADGSVESTIPITPPGGAQSYTGMAVDPTSGEVYLSSCDISTSVLYTLDVNSGTASQIGSITGSPCTIAIAIDGSGQMYGHDIVLDSFLSIDKSSGAGTVIGPIGFDANFGQGMGWDEATDQIYLAAFNNSAFQAELRIADRSTGNTTLVGVLGQTIPGGLTQLPFLAIPISGGTQWASAVPESGTIPAGATATFEVVFDARSMTEVGTFTAELSFSGDFSNEPPVMPLTMHLSCPACGFLNGSITDATTGDPLSADIHITGPSGFDLTLTGDSYSIAVQPGDYDFTVSASGYVTETASVTVEQGETVTTDFALVPAAGVLEYSPPAIMATVLWGDSETETLTISNTGTVPFDFELSDAGIGSPLRVPYTPPAAASASANDLREYQLALPKRGAEIVKSNAPQQDLLLDQQPNAVNGLFADVSCDLCGGSQVLAENFSLSGSVDIGQINFWTGYFPTDTPIDPDEITVIFHTDSGGLPGPAIYTESPVAYERVQTGVILFGVHEWLHTLTLDSPVTLGPGNYWVELYNDTGFAGFDFFWETGNPDTIGNGLPGSVFAFTAPGSGWNFDPFTELAIQLLTPGAVDAPWVTESPDTGTLNPGESVDVDVIFDSSVVTQTGDYTADLIFDGDFVNDVPTASLVMHVTESAVDTGPDQSASGALGDEVMYTVTITNTGLVADTFDLSLSGNVWESHVMPESTGMLDPGESTTVTLTVHIPENAFPGNSDAVVLTATSVADNLVSDSMTATTSVSGQHMIFLPALFKQQ